ncbi:MAG: CDP-diacylglycerol--glycerol-3-phosphate 3-phosphatidyltransferase [Oscillospiraceae bacterium]
MNTPNKITVLRVILVPIFLIFMLIPSIPFNYLIAFLIFVAISISDFLDGYLARKNNMVTTFGKFLDPLADKVAVISALLCFCPINMASIVALIIIISREFMVSALRLVAVSEGIVIAAGNLGKIKTAFSMITILITLFLLGININTQIVSIISNTLVWITAFFTVISGIEYMVKNKNVINSTK